MITGGNITSVHRDLIQLLSKNNTESDLRKQVEQSLTEHLYAQLKDYLKTKKWREADIQTDILMFNIAKREKEQFLYLGDINSFSCPDLRNIDKLWSDNSKGRFGVSVQKKIWIQTGNRLGIKLEQWNNKDYKNYLQFARAVGWYDDKVKDLVSYELRLEDIKRHPSLGSLPSMGQQGRWGNIELLLFSRCDL